VANDDISLTLLPGQIQAILGENGAGKSTLMKIIYGLVKPDSGEIWFDDQQVFLENPQQARDLGIGMVFQHFNLFESFNVAQNIWLGLEKSVTLKQVHQNILIKSKEYGIDLDPKRPVHTLSVGQMQSVEIIRALLTEPTVLILDEPTSVLTPQAIEQLFETLQKVADQGCSILYISHKLDEIRRLCNSCTVIRKGKVVASCNPQEETNASLSRLMIGNEPLPLMKRKIGLGQPVLKVENLSLKKQDLFGVDLKSVSLTVHAGEIVGIAGVSGNGQQELLMTLSGEDTRPEAGMINIKGQPVGKYDPTKRRQCGLHFIPEERQSRGTVPHLSLAKNTLLTRQQAIGWGGWINPTILDKQATEIIRRFHVKANNSQAIAQDLSGGNLQKYIVGREIDAAPEILIIGQPTWGIDVGAASFIHNEILKLRDSGCTILIVSEDLDELLALSDRIYVIAKGQLSPPMLRAQADIEKIGQWMSGLWKEALPKKQEGFI
jgi:simple sugar transport system ATP-binding protein